MFNPHDNKPACRYMSLHVTIVCFLAVPFLYLIMNTYTMHESMYAYLLYRLQGIPVLLQITEFHASISLHLVDTASEDPDETK